MATYTWYVGADSQNLGWNQPVSWYLGYHAGFTYNTTSTQANTYSTTDSVTLPWNEYPVSITIQSYNSHPAYIRNRYPASSTQVYNNTSGKYDTVYSAYPQIGSFYLAATDGSAFVHLFDLNLPDTTFNYAGSIYYFDNQVNTWNINGQSLMGKTLCIYKDGGGSAGLEFGNRAKVTITTQQVGGRVTIAQTTGGTVTADGSVYSAGATITCTATPQAYYRLSSVDLTPAGVSNITYTSTGFTLVMPNPTTDIVITPHFAYHEIIWDQPKLTAVQNGNEITVTKSGTATETWGESMNIFLMIGDSIVATFNGDSVTITDAYFTPGEIVNLRLVAMNSSVGSVGCSMNFLTAADYTGIVNYYTGSGYQPSYIRRYNGTEWEDVM